MADVVPPDEAPYARHVYHQYTVRILGGRRDAVHKRLAEMGVGTMVYYPVPVHKLPVYAGSGCHLPVAEQAATEVLSLPIWPQITHEQQEAVVTRLRQALT